MGHCVPNSHYPQRRRGGRGWARALVLSLVTYASLATGQELPAAYPNATLELSESRVVRNYPVMSGRLKKIRGELRSAGSQWLDGVLERRLYEIPPGHAGRKVFEQYLSQIKALGGDVVFVCQGRDCGPSNVWANEVFGLASLYGHDREQYYALLKREPATVEEQPVYYLLYTITRGTHRVYTLVDQFLPQFATP